MICVIIFDWVCLQLKCATFRSCSSIHISMNFSLHWPYLPYRSITESQLINWFAYYRAWNRNCEPSLGKCTITTRRQLTCQGSFKRCAFEHKLTSPRATLSKRSFRTVTILWSGPLTRIWHIMCCLRWYAFFSFPICVVLIDNNNRG